MSDGSSKLHWVSIQWLSVLLVCSLLVSASFSGIVAGQSDQQSSSSQADRVLDDTAPVVVFQGERVNLSQVRGTTGETPGERAGLVGIKGAAVGTYYEDESDSFDFDRVEPGSYDFDRDRRSDIVVRQPNIQSIRLFRGPPSDGINVTNGRISLSQDQMTITTDYNFVQSNEKVSVAVINPDGLDITNELTTSPTISKDGDVVTLSNLRSLETGQFIVRATGTGDFTTATQTVSFTRGSEDADISISDSSVQQGGIITGTIRGNAGQRVQVRIPHTATANDTTADQAYENSANIAYLTDQPTVGGPQYHTAVIDIGSRGQEQIRINTRTFRINQDVSISVADGTNIANSAGNRAFVRVTSPQLTVTSASDVVVLGNTFRIAGSGPSNGIVRAYVRNRSNYVPLRDTDGTAVEITTQADGRYEFVASTSKPIAQSGSYEILITANDQNDQNELLTSTYLQDVPLQAITTIRTQEQNLTTTLSTDRIATNTEDSITLTGYTTDQSIRLYIINPQGTVTTAAGTPIQQLDESEELEVADQMFTKQITALDTVGTYRITVVSAQTAADWNTVNNVELDGLDSEETAEKIRDQYLGAKSSFSVVTRSVQANSPQLSIATPRRGEQLSQGTITITGQSNRENGHDISIEILEQNETVLSTQTRVDGRNNSWKKSLDSSTLRPGSYTLRVSDGASTTSTVFEIAGSPPPNNTVSTQTETTEQATTGVGGPGFTILSVVATLSVFIIIITLRRME